MRTVAVAIISALAFLGVAVSAFEIRHYSKHGHLVSYGWHVDVMTGLDNGAAVSGVRTLRWAKVTNFTLSPGAVEACILPNDGRPHEIPVFPYRIEKLDMATGAWVSWPLSLMPMCLNLPIVPKMIWPFRSYRTESGAIAALDWFRKGDWIRFVLLSKCDKPTEIHHEFISQPFQLIEERHRSR